MKRISLVGVVVTFLLTTLITPAHAVDLPVPSDRDDSDKTGIDYIVESKPALYQKLLPLNYVPPLNEEDIMESFQSLSDKVKFKITSRNNDECENLNDKNNQKARKDEDYKYKAVALSSSAAPVERGDGVEYLDFSTMVCVRQLKTDYDGKFINIDKPYELVWKAHDKILTEDPAKYKSSPDVTSARSI
jgi:hypothetical protein